MSCCVHPACQSKNGAIANFDQPLCQITGRSFAKRRGVSGPDDCDPRAAKGLAEARNPERWRWIWNCQKSIGIVGSAKLRSIALQICYWPEALSVQSRNGRHFIIHYRPVWRFQAVRQALPSQCQTGATVYKCAYADTV